MEQSRLPRFKRASQVPPIELSDRDRTIIQLVHRHRFLRSSHIHSLVPGSAQQLLRRLQLLYHHGYLERPHSQLDYYHHGGSHCMVYGIGNKGASLLQAELGLQSAPLRSGEKNRAVHGIFLQHALLVSDVMVSFELGCRERGSVRLLTEDTIFPAGCPATQAQPFRWHVKVKGNVLLGVIPDRTFALEYEDRNRQQVRIFFFLEADRGTMPVTRSSLEQTSFYRKLLAYEATWSQGIHRTQFGFHRFRVLTVTSSLERRQSLVEACSKLRSGHGLFLFASSGSIKQPRDVFSSIWHPARQGEPARLID